MAEEARAQAERLAVAWAEAAAKAAEAAERSKLAAQAAKGVLHVAAAVVREVELERVVSVVLDQTLRSLGARAVQVYQVSEERLELNLLGQRNVPADLIDRLQRVSLDAPLLAARAARTRQLQIVEDPARLDPPLTLARDLLTRTGSASMLAVPLIAFERLIGVLTYTYPDPHRFEPDELGAIVASAEIFAVSLANAQAYEERKRAEEVLRKSEDSLARAQAIAHLGNWDWDLRSGELRWSDEIIRILGLNPRQFDATYEAFLSCVHPDDRVSVKRAIDEAIREQKRYSFDHRVVRPDGSVRFVHEQVDVVRDEAGRPIRMVGTVQDVTERREAEEALEDLIRQNQLILNSAGEGIYGLDRQGRATFVNPAAVAMLGWAAEDLIGKPMHSLLHYAKADGTPYPVNECPIYAAFRDGHVHRVSNEVFWRKDGTSFPVEYVSTPIWDNGELHGAVVIFSDVSARRQAEETLRQSERQFRGLFDGALDAVAIVDDDRRFVDVNLQASIVFGVPRSELLGQTIDKYIPADTTPGIEEQWRNFVARGEGQGEYTVRLPDGSLRQLEYQAKANFIPGRHLSIMRDITERKRAEEERRRLLVQEQQARAAAETERARLQAILDNAANGILFVDAATGYLTVNPSAIHLFGRSLTPEGGAAQFVGYLRRPDGHVLTRDEFPGGRALRGERVLGENLVIVRPDGSELPVLVSAAPVQGPGPKMIGAVVVLQDISALRDLERLREEWTSVIAHDLRAPITVINGYVQLLAGIGRGEHGSERERRALTAIQTNTQRLARMVSDLLDASRIEARRLRLECRSLDLLDLIRTIVAQTGEITRGHAVCVDVDGEVPPVDADPDRIQQVVINLLSNAAKYSYPGTDIEIRVARREVEIEVSVTDRGEGISSADLPRLFSRFHRARRAEAEGVAGLGLGLYISKGLVEAHGGRIWAESTPGQTTTYYFTLPLIAKEESRT